MDPAIVIEAGTGVIRLGDRDRLLPWEPLDAIAPRVADLVRHRQDFGTGYEWLYLHKLSLGGQPAHLSLCFERKRLEMANLNVALPDARDGWPGKAEMDAEIAFVRAALAGMIGFKPTASSMSFGWGSVWSDYDPKADMASSGLRYAR